MRPLFLPKEVKAVLGILDEAACRFQGRAFARLHSLMKSDATRNTDNIVQLVESGISPRTIVYSSLSNIAGDELESGKHHIYRGRLNPIGEGPELLALYRAAVSELHNMGELDKERHDAEQSAINKNIRNAG